MNVSVMLLSSTGGNPLEQVSKPVVKLLNMALTPVFGIVGALGAIYCIFLGAKPAKAEEPQDREEAKNSLKSAIIGFVLIFVLIAILKTGMDAVSNWMNNTMSNATPQLADNGKTVLRLIRRSTAHAGQDIQEKQLGGGVLYEKKIEELSGHSYRPQSFFHRV